MTTLSHGNRIAQHLRVSRFERAVFAAKAVAADLAGIFSNWSAAQRELAEVIRTARLAKRSQRLIRTAI